MGNGINNRDHSLAGNEINVFFDCEEGGHWWTYTNGAAPYCNGCLGWSFSSTDFSGGPYGTFNQLQWDYDLGQGYQIQTDQVNIKIDTGNTASADDEWYITTALDEVWTYNQRKTTPYTQNIWCTLRHKIGNTNQYDKWVSQSSTTRVAGREAMMDCSTNADPIKIEILC